MRLTSVCLISLFLLGIGCAGKGEEEIIVGFAGGEKSLAVTNYSNRTVYYFAVDQSELPLLDWIPTTNPLAPIKRLTEII